MKTILFPKLSKKKNKVEEVEYRGIFSELCSDGLLDGLVQEYVELCHGIEASQKDAKRSARFANLAGFCRHVGTGLKDFESLKSSHPEEYDKILAVFEDEALNSGVSPTLLSTYVKKRISYSEAEHSTSKEVSYRFEHDIFADGE